MRKSLSLLALLFCFAFTGYAIAHDTAEKKEEKDASVKTKIDEVACMTTNLYGINDVDKYGVGWKLASSDLAESEGVLKNPEYYKDLAARSAYFNSLTCPNLVFKVEKFAVRLVELAPAREDASSVLVWEKVLGDGVHSVAHSVWYREVAPAETKVSNFDECAAAGGVILERYPRQCELGDQWFEEEAEETSGE